MILNFSKNAKADEFKKLNLEKSFRPFAPIVLAEKAKEWFNFKGKELREQFNSPYMLLVGEVNSSQVKLETENKLNGFERLENINSIDTRCYSCQRLC